MKTLNERIVELQKIDSAGVISTEEAELRQVNLLGMEPKDIKVVLAHEFGVQLTMDWDAVNEKFSTTYGEILGTLILIIKTSWNRLGHKVRTM